jgi:hypothetical protein
LEVFCKKSFKIPVAAIEERQTIEWAKKKEKDNNGRQKTTQKMTDWAARSQPKNSGAPQGEVIPALLVVADLLIHRL